MDAPLLELRSISFAYEDQPCALRDLTVSISAGERIAVIGRNGAGKSTFFLCCNGVLFPQRGGIFLHGQQILPKKRSLNLLRQSVGIVFQDPNQQLIGATVREEISFGPMNLGLSEAQVHTQVEQALRSMDLAGMEDRPPHTLSGGEKKRLSIAGVLAMAPDLILLDEPTAFLDSEAAQALEGILDALHRQGKTLMVSTHDLDFACRWATRVLVFLDGSLFADGTPQAVFDCRLLERAGLRLPLLCQLANGLKGRGLLPEAAFPRTVQELIDALSPTGAPGKP